MNTDHSKWLETEDPGWRRLLEDKNVFGNNFVTTDGSGDRIRIRYFLRDSDRSLMAKVLFGPGAQGPPGHVHGGCIAAVLDESMGRAAWMLGHMVVAAELTAKFRKMVPLDVPFVITTRIVEVNGRRVKLGSELKTLSGEVHSEGEALFITLGPDKFGELAKTTMDRIQKSPHASKSRGGTQGRKKQ